VIADLGGRMIALIVRCPQLRVQAHGYLDARQRLTVIVALEVADGQITSIKSIVNPEKLAHLGPTADLGSLLRTQAPGS
jgi:hypothetical protein